MIQIKNLENCIEFQEDKVITLGINNKKMFSLVCEAFLLEDDQCVEVIKVFDQNNKEIDKQSFIVINQLPILPFDNKKLIEKMYKSLDKSIEIDVNAYERINNLGREIEAELKNFSVSKYGTYAFALDWNVIKFLNAYKYSVNLSHCENFYDKLCEFIKFLADARVDDPLVFINLKTFLEEKELNGLFELLIFYNIKALLIENWHTSKQSNYEVKYRCDLDFIETIS